MEEGGGSGERRAVLLFFLNFNCRKLRQKILGKMVINMSIALIGLYVFALMGGSQLITAHHIVCAVVGALLHYFMLVYFLWTAVESIDLYRKLVIIIGRDIDHYPFFGGLVAWGE